MRNVPSVRRPLFAFLAGVLLALAAFALPASAQLGTQVELTTQSVEDIIASYPEVKATADALKTKYKVGAGNDVGSTWSNWLAYGDARAQFDAVVQQHGFDNFETWVTTLISVALAYAFAKDGGQLDASMQQAFDQINNNANLTDAQKQMMSQQMQASMGAVSTLRPSDANVAAVTPYLDQLATVLEAGH